MLGEIGGYVGLFLGVSINQTSNLLAFLFARLEQLHKHVTT